MSRLVWSADAQRDLRAITIYYRQIAPDLSDRLIERIEEAATKLIDFPRLGAKLPDSDVRIWSAKATPYLLFDRETREGIRILQVRDARSDWKARG